MLFSIALILLLGYLVGLLFEKIRIPRLVGMILVGILFGPHVLNLIDESVLAISAVLRQIALIIILTRAGLSLDLKSLKQIGRPAILMCFLPATFEIIGVTLFAPKILNISVFEALLLGSVLGAVSPAVVVPRMINLQKQGYGTKNKIPELLLAGSSADDIYVIVLFYAFLGLAKDNTFSPMKLIDIPVSIILGVILGIIVGFILRIIFKKLKSSLVTKILITLTTSFLMITFEEAVKDIISISALLGVMTFGMIILYRNKEEASEIESGYNKLWFFFEIFLFVLVGAEVNINYAASAGVSAIFVLLISLGFRAIGVMIAVMKTKLSWKERLFSIVAYLPKATVQASIGAIPLSMGLASGNIILSVAVLSIIITASIGAIGMDGLYKKLLDIDPLKEQTYEDNKIM